MKSIPVSSSSVMSVCEWKSAFLLSFSFSKISISAGFPNLAALSGGNFLDAFSLGSFAGVTRNLFINSSWYFALFMISFKLKVHFRWISHFLRWYTRCICCEYFNNFCSQLLKIACNAVLVCLVFYHYLGMAERIQYPSGIETRF